MNRTRYAANAFAGQVGFSMLAFSGAVITARLLGPAGKGVVTAWSVAVALGAVALGGSIAAGLGRAFLSGKREEILAGALLHGLCALGICIPVALVGYLIGADPIALVAFVVVSIPATVITLDLLVAFQAAKSPWVFHGSRMVAAAVLMVGALLLLAIHARHARDLVFVISAVSTVVGAVILIGYAWVRFGPPRHPGLIAASRLGRGSYIASLSDWLILRLDQLIVAALAGATPLGLYGVAVNFSEIGQYLGHSIGHAVFEDERTLSNHTAIGIFKRGAKYVGSLTALIVAAGFFLIVPIFGSKFAGSRWPLVFLAPGIVTRTVGYTAGQMLLARGQGVQLSKASLSALALAIPAWVLGTVTLGISGTAIGNSFGYTAQMIFILRAFRSAPSAAGNGVRGAHDLPGSGITGMLRTDLRRRRRILATRGDQGLRWSAGTHARRDAGSLPVGEPNEEIADRLEETTVPGGAPRMVTAALEAAQSRWQIFNQAGLLNQSPETPSGQNGEQIMNDDPRTDDSVAG